MEERESEPPKGPSNRTLVAIAGTAVTVSIPLVFPQIPLEAGIAIWTGSGALALYAGRDWIRAHLPARWRSNKLKGDLPIVIIPTSPILIVGLVQAQDVPHQGFTAIRVVIRNQSGQNLTGLVARLVQSDPPLDGMAGATHLPLTLATKTRLDRLRNPEFQEPLPPLPFNLNAGCDKQVEVAWLASNAMLEGHITHEAGEATFLFVTQHQLEIEISGAGPPLRARIRIDETDDGSWTASLIDEAPGEGQ